MRKTIQIAMVSMMIFTLNSCFITHTTVGDGPIGKDNVTARYSHAKQMYVLWGLLSLKQTQPAIPHDCGYQVKSSFNFVDVLASGVTLGIFGMRTVKILVRKDGPCDPKVMKIERKEDKEIHKLEEKEHR
jgi:hypothetical protein